MKVQYQTPETLVNTLNLIQIICASGSDKTPTESIENVSPSGGGTIPGMPKKV